MLKLILLLAFSPIYKASEVLQKGQREVLRCQNDLRSHISMNGHFMAGNKNASNMRELNYAKDLEALAKNFLARRQFILSTEDRLNGFTIFRTTGWLSDWDLARADCENREILAQLGAWTPTKLTKTNFDTIGNWFQAIWAKASKIGCAFQQLSEKNRKKWTVLVCKYDVAMEVGKEVYKVGKPCSGCEKMKTRCEYLKMLCILG